MFRRLAAALPLILAPAAAAGQSPPDRLPIEVRPLPGLKADVAALLMSGRESGALRAAVLAAPFPGAAGKSDVVLWVEVDGASLVPEASAEDGAEAAPKSLRLEVHAYAMTPQGSLAAALGETFRLPLAEGGAALAAGGVKYSGHLELDPGSYRLRVLVRERRSQRFVLRIVPLTVPSADTPFLLPPFFADAAQSWIEARGGGPAPAPASALPVLAAGHENAARLLLHDSGAAPLVSARLLDAERRPVATVDPKLGAATPGPGLDAVEASFELPADLATGNYFLETSLAGGPATALPVYVLGRRFQGEALAWTDVQRLGSRTTRRQEGPDLTSRRVSKRVAAIARAYRKTLARLAAGDLDEAVAALDRLESEVLSAENPEARSWLVTAQDQVIAELARSDAESLVPVLLLHVEQHFRSLEARAAERAAGEDFAFHTRERVIATARLYAKECASELAPTMAASVLADMGVALRQAELRVASRRMMEEALALDPESSVALLGVAVDHEWRGEPATAAAYLRRLLAVDPRAEEARLRLALDLRRTGERQEAARLLRRTLDEGVDEGLVTLAHQELGRILLQSGRPAAAVRLLEAGIRRLPAQTRLYVQLAYALDRAGESRRARQVLERMPAGRAGPPSPRLLYSRLRSEEGTHRPELLRQGMARLALLARALDESSSGTKRRKGKR